jgi:hypothetical protein
MKRIQRKRTKGWRMPENAVYVGRPTKWGNPFRMGDCIGEVQAWIVLAAEHDDKVPSYRLCFRAAMDLYRAWIGRRISSGKCNLNELRGKDLVCWCPLDQPCHADVLIELCGEVTG